MFRSMVRLRVYSLAVRLVWMHGYGAGRGRQVGGCVVVSVRAKETQGGKGLAVKGTQGRG